MSFQAVGRDGEVLLEWKTINEIDIFGFHIDRSLDAVAFQRISVNIIPGAGSSETGETYTYVDQDVINGTTYYYNLITVSSDGLEEVADQSPVSATPSAYVPVPQTYALHQNFPNPFNTVTEIRYVLSGEVHVTLKVYNSLGAEVATLLNAVQEANLYDNFHTVRWNGTDLTSGMYFCRLKAGDFHKAIKMVFLK